MQVASFLCAYCHRHTTQPVPCQGCRYLVYCCPAHREQHWLHEHHHQCGEIATECRVAFRAATLYESVGGQHTDAFKTLLAQFPHQYLSLRLYGRALLTHADRDAASSNCYAWTAALSFLLAAEQSAMRGQLVRSTESGLALYHDILYAAMHIQQCKEHAHADIHALIPQYQQKEQRFKRKAVSGLLLSGKYPPEFMRWATTHFELGDRAYTFWFHAYPTLKRLGFDRWREKRKEEMIRSLCKPILNS